MKRIKFLAGFVQKTTDILYFVRNVIIIIAFALTIYEKYKQVKADR